MGNFQVRNFCRLEEVHENFIGDNFCGMLKQLHRWMWHAQNFVIVDGPQLRIQAPSIIFNPGDEAIVTSTVSHYWYTLFQILLHKKCDVSCEHKVVL